MPETVQTRQTPEDFLPKTRRVIAPRWAPLSDVAEKDFDERLDLIAECARVVRLLRFDATSLPLDDVMFEVLRDGIMMSVRMLVPNRDSRELSWIQVWRNLVVPWAPLAMNGPDMLVRALRDVVAGAVLHEIDESLTYDDQRVFDPHRPLGLR
jgi:hypothetical protein